MIESATYEPLDAKTCKHHLAIWKSMECARPVMFEGRSYFIKYVRGGPSGGSVDMDVWLDDRPDPISAKSICIPELKID